MAQFEILPGLPPYGPEAEAFSATGHGKHREGFVVRFASDAGEAWIGNFQPGGGGLSGVFMHPDGVNLIVISGGQGYVVNPNSRHCVLTFGSTVESAFEISEHGMIVFGDGIRFEAIGATGLIWQSGRISWDGMRDLIVDGLVLRGQAWDISDQWMPFQLDIINGTFMGGSYNGPDTRRR